MTRNVALVVLDTVRKDYFDEYAPRLRELADVSFEQCRAASSCSVPSHASMLTGTLPHRHGVHSGAVDYAAIDEGETFLADLPAHRKVGVSANTFAGTPFGFDAHFDEFVDVSWTRRFPSGMDAREFVTRTDASGAAFYWAFLRAALAHDHTLATAANAALAQVDVLLSRLPVPKALDDGAAAALGAARERTAEEPFFLFCNLMEAHTPHQPTRGYDRSLYDAPSDWSSMRDLDQWDLNRHGTEGHEADVGHFRDLYAASVDYLDRRVASFVADLLAATDRETTVVVTADHGENLGFRADGELFGHNSSLSEALLHVPLTVVNPPEGYPERVAEYVSHLSLGRLLVGLAEGRTPDVTADRVAAERILTTNLPDVEDDEHRYWNRMLRCVYDGAGKVVWDSLGECASVDLDRDRPCWERERSGGPTEPPAWARAHFGADIEAVKREVEGEGPTDVDEATRARLEELGYL
jgi:arylsulfatase A-like enzyme